MTPRPAPGARLRRLWRFLAPLPGGTWLFSRILGWMVPYTATLGARVRHLEPGRAVVTLRDRRRVRNHLGSIHAAALVNLGEVTSGLAMTVALPGDVRGIVVALSTDFFKKARGPLTAESSVPVADVAEVATEREVTVEAEIRDRKGDLVARTRAVWRVEPVP